MNSRTTARRTSVAVIAAASALAVAACGSPTAADDTDLGAGAVSVASTSTPSAPASTSAPAASSAPSGSPSTTSPSGFAQRAGILPERHTDTDAEIDVDDQSGDGRTVRLEEARLSGGNGHVVILTRDGKVLGSAPITRNTSPVSVRLTTPVPATGQLEAVLFTDDGDATFDITKDRAINDGDDDRDDDDDDRDDDRHDLEDEDFTYTLR